MGVKRSWHCVYNLHYHFVCPLKYREVLLNEEIEKYFVEVCKEIGKRYEIEFEKIGMDKNHVHVLCGAAPKYSPSRLITVIKSITAREMFKKFPEVKEKLWGGEFWSDGYYVGSVGEGGNKEVIEKYIARQGQKPHEVQLKLFDLK